MGTKIDGAYGEEGVLRERNIVIIIGMAIIILVSMGGVATFKRATETGERNANIRKTPQVAFRDILAGAQKPRSYHKKSHHTHNDKTSRPAHKKNLPQRPLKGTKDETRILPAKTKSVQKAKTNQFKQSAKTNQFKQSAKTNQFKQSAKTNQFKHHASLGAKKPSVNLVIFNRAIIPKTRPPKPESFDSTKSTESFNSKERYCLTQAVYFEARSEPMAGQQAVAETVLNRVRSQNYPDNICGVVFQNQHRKNKCQFSFACDGKTDKPKNMKAWKKAKKIVKKVLDDKSAPKIIHSATHYHADYVTPIWATKMIRKIKIGRHIFYSES